MPRKPKILQNEYPYHVLNRMTDRQFFPLPISEVWKIFEDVIFETVIRYGIQIHAFLLMNNHYHLLVSTPDFNLSGAMQFLQSRVARAISLAKGTDSVRFQSRYKSSMVTSRSYFFTVLSYIYLNPVRAKMTSRADDYKFSTLHGVIGKSHLKIPLSSHTLGHELFNMNPENFSEMVQNSISNDISDKISKGLRKSVFAIKKYE